MDKRKEKEEMSKKVKVVKVTIEENEKTSDPQEHMEGPVSSIMQTIKDEGAKNNKESQEEADKKRMENM